MNNIKIPKGYKGPFLITTDGGHGDVGDAVVCGSVEHAQSQIAHFIKSLEVAPSDIQVWLLSSVAVTEIADYTVEGMPDVAPER